MEGDWADTQRSSSNNMMVAEPEAPAQVTEGRESLAQSAPPLLAPIQVVPDRMAAPELVAGAKGPRAVMNGLNKMNYEVIVSYGSGNMYSIVRKLRDAIFGKVIRYLYIFIRCLKEELKVEDPTYGSLSCIWHDDN